MVMPKKRLFAIVFFLLLPSVSSLANTTMSGEVQLYTGTVQDGQIVDVDDFEFEFKVASEGGVLIRYNGQGIIVMEGDCKYKDNLHFCVGDISWAYRNLTVWKDIYQADIDISIVKGALGITRNIEKTELLIDDTSKIEVFLENTGNREIQNVIYTDSYPDSFRITDIEGCSLKDNGVGWEGNIPAKVIESCSYTLVGLKADEYDSKAEASYFDGVSIQNIYSDEVEIEVKNYSLEVKTYLNKDKLEIGNFVNLTISLENINEDEKISIWSFKIDVPSNLKILKNKGLTKDRQTLSWRGDLESEEAKNFSIDMLAERAGNITIYIQEDYKDVKFRREFLDFINLNVYCDCLLIRHKISDKIVAGEETDFKVYIFNPSYENKFNDIKVDVFTNIPNAEEISKTYPVLDKRQDIIFFNDKIKVPEEGFYYYNASINYKSDFGQYFKNKKSILIKGEVVEEIEESETEEIEAELVNETTELIIGEEQATETIENVTQEEIETTVVNMESKKLPLKYIIMGLIALIVFGIVLSILKIKKIKKEIKPPKIESLLIFLLLISMASLFLLEPSITGFAVYNLDANFIENNISYLGAMVIIFIFMLLVIYKREPRIQ